MRQDSLGVESVSQMVRHEGKQEGQLPRTFGSRAGRHRAAAVRQEQSTSMRLSDAGTDALVSWNAALLDSDLCGPVERRTSSDATCSGADPCGLPMIGSGRTPTEHLPAAPIGPHEVVP